jgi:tetrahydromethanopterin S-methyltransferase subunit B
MKSYIELMEEKIKLEKELRECDTKGDKILISRKLDKIKEQIKELEETTVSGDIAVAPDPMNKKLLRKPKLEDIEESVTFKSFFDLDKNTSEFKL